MNIYFFGAGASAAEGAPATQDVFASAWKLLAPDFAPPVAAVWRFLETVFQVPVTGPAAFELLPAVDEVISLVDWSLHVNQGLGHSYDPPRLYEVRRALEYLLCATLDRALAGRRQADGARGQADGARSRADGTTAPADGAHARFVRQLLAQSGPGRFALLSLNYDTLLDDALARAGVTPDYGFRALDLAPRQGPLLAKLHGSLNWALCPACGHIEIAGGQVAHLLPPGAAAPAVGLTCSRCANPRPHGLIISPTALKSYAGAHLQHIWDLALESLQRADRLTFVGYSMPPADVPVYHLIRRGLLAGRGCRRPAVHVINHTAPRWSDAQRAMHEEAVAARFRHLFGGGVTFDFSGFHGQV